MVANILMAALLDPLVMPQAIASIQVRTLEPLVMVVRLPLMIQN